MIESICDMNKCTGCSLCAAVCPVDAISMQYNLEGFLVPFIKEKCIECNMCKKKCIVNSAMESKAIVPKAYIAWNKECKVRRSSSSGGVFSALAEYVIAQGGWVYGAVFAEDFKVEHIGVNSTECLEPMRGSKYIQSDITQCYAEIKEKLSQGGDVLFAGTPCQVYALKRYCGDAPKLFTCDLVCYGVASTAYFLSILDHLRKRYKADIKSVSFRKKKYGYINSSFCVEFKNNKRYEKIRDLSEFGLPFTANVINRKSCSECSYMQVGDITLGDLPAGVKREERVIDVKNGMSTCIVNTEKGEQLLDAIIFKGLYVEEVDYEVVKKNTLGFNHKGYDLKKRDEFMQDYIQRGYEYTQQNYERVPLKKRVYLRFYTWIVLIKNIKSLLRNCKK